MLNRLPPRIHMFVRQMFFMAVGVFAATGAFAMYQGRAQVPDRWVVLGLTLGAALAAVMRDIPSDILLARETKCDQT
ncbi:MAG: hypothetical protein Q8Q53_12120 [Novosphingobium sp.]|nr:hypothetical protein [Novosphingobium sp.]